MKPLTRVLVPLCMLLLAACGGGDDAPKVPTANAGVDQTLQYGGTVSLNASASSSPRTAATLSYTWTIASKPAGSAAELSSTSVPNPTFIADLPGTYEFDLVVNDGAASSAHDRVIITAHQSRSGGPSRRSSRMS